MIYTLYLILDLIFKVTLSYDIQYIDVIEVWQTLAL